MSIEFLKNIYTELLEEKKELELEQSSIAIKRKENEKYIQKFQKEEENYDVFSPRNQNHNLKKRINSFEKKNEILFNRSKEIDIKLNNLKEKIQGFDSIFQEENERKLISIKNARQKKKIHKLQKIYFNDISSIIHKLEFCSQLIDVDMNRCKLELSLLIKILYERKNNSKKLKKEINISETKEGELSVGGNPIDDR